MKKQILLLITLLATGSMVAMDDNSRKFEKLKIERAALEAAAPLSPRVERLKKDFLIDRVIAVEIENSFASLNENDTSEEMMKKVEHIEEFTSYKRNITQVMGAVDIQELVWLDVSNKTKNQLIIEALKIRSRNKK